MSERHYIADDYLVKVSRGVRECVLDGQSSIAGLSSVDLREAWLILSAYTADLRAELNRREKQPLEGGEGA